MDSSYRQPLTVQAQQGLPADLHEFIISEAGIAFFTAYRTYTTDLSSVGGPTQRPGTRRHHPGRRPGQRGVGVRLEQRDHISFSESYQTYSPDAPFDPVHLNSIDFTPDGNVAGLGAQHLDRLQGRPEFRRDHPGASEGRGATSRWARVPRFARQHDARPRMPTARSASSTTKAIPRRRSSRAGLVLDVDETEGTATMKRPSTSIPTSRLLAGSQGSVQVLPSGNVLVGWGAEPYYSELQADGHARPQRRDALPARPTAPSASTGPAGHAISRRSGHAVGGPFLRLRLLERLDRDGDLAAAFRSLGEQPAGGVRGPAREGFESSILPCRRAPATPR